MVSAAAKGQRQACVRLQAGVGDLGRQAGPGVVRVVEYLPHDELVGRDLKVSQVKKGLAVDGL